LHCGTDGDRDGGGDGETDGGGDGETDGGGDGETDGGSNGGKGGEMRQHDAIDPGRSMQAAPNEASSFDSRQDSSSPQSHNPLYQRYSQVQSSPLLFGGGGEGGASSSS